MRIGLGFVALLVAGLGLTQDAGDQIRQEYNVCTYGASTTATPSENAKAINAAILDASKTHGRVIIPTGIYTSGTVRLKSQVELHLQKGAVLKGSTAEADYNRTDEFPENFASVPEEWSGSHLLLGLRLENIAITGEGTIDGSGPAFFREFPDYASLFPGYKYGLKLHTIDREWFRPGPVIALFQCRNVRIEGITLTDTPCWTIHCRCCDGVRIHGVSILADQTIANSDGLSIDCCRNVDIRNCNLRTGDDGIAIRAACALHATTNACEQILVDNCDIWSCCFGVRIGIGSGTIRDVQIQNCRIHESSSAFGFTPAWVVGEKGVYIENVRVDNCTGGETEKMVSFDSPADDARIKDITFSNCRFATLQPSDSVGGNPKCKPENIRFVNCRRDYLERQKTCYSLHWHRTAGKRSYAFWKQRGECGKVTFENCRPNPNPHGVLLLSFDDRNFSDWLAALPLFDKYDAKATFYISGNIVGKAVRDIKKISAAGHSLGLHGRAHVNADEMVKKDGYAAWYRNEIAIPHRQAQVAWLLDFRTFAYPNGRGTEEIDQHLFKAGWERIRGVSALRPNIRSISKRTSQSISRKPLAEEDSAFVPYAEFASRPRYDSILLGEDYATDIEEVCMAIRRAGARKEVLALSSHGIRPNAKGIHLKTEWLERMLQTAQEAGVVVVGIDYFR